MKFDKQSLLISVSVLLFLLAASMELVSYSEEFNLFIQHRVWVNICFEPDQHELRLGVEHAYLLLCAAYLIYLISAYKRDALRIRQVLLFLTFVLGVPTLLSWALCDAW